VFHRVIVLGTNDFWNYGSWNSEGSSVSVLSQFLELVCLQVSVPGGLVTPLMKDFVEEGETTNSSTFLQGFKVELV